MKVTLTADEIMNKGLWDEFCEMKGINEWAMNEGLMDGNEEFTFTRREAIKLRLIEGTLEDDSEPLQAGDTLYGYCGGYFGRDAHGDKLVEAVGPDWVVCRLVGEDPCDDGRHPLCFYAGDLSKLDECRNEDNDW